MKRFNTLAAVLCAVSVMYLFGCASSQVVDEEPIVLEAAPVPSPAPTPSAPTPVAPEPAPAPTPATPAPVNSATPPAAPAPATPPTAAVPPAEPEAPATPVVVNPMPAKPEYCALVFLEQGKEITLEGLRNSQLFGSEDFKPSKNFIGIAMARPGDRVRMLNYNALRDTTNRSGSVPVDSLSFVQAQSKRAQRFTIGGRTTRTIGIPVKNADGSTTVWHFRFYPLPDCVMETLRKGSITWSIWGNTESGGFTSIGSRSFVQDTISLDAGSNYRFVAQEREDGTHQWGIRRVSP